ncbi:hypothetical protein RI049_09145 [Cedecea neteri]|uniref:hypothetical protein n=1 Tax=Cedecea neteri TaxID=158822 RepID=UPI002AA60652|nr:hypothetical protein [Cedecea neteri]WPU24882.1 hypothetical protein RI049_09145 [Cedecea neteri]
MRLLIAVLCLVSVSANASCWSVSGVKGSSYSEREGYSRIDDGYSGKFTIVIDGDNASVVYNGLDAGGMVYKPMGPNVVVGLTTEPLKHVMETWVIQQNGVVLMTKTLSGFGGVDSSKAMVGRVVGRCG